MQYYAPSGLGEFDSCTRGDALRACPWLSYSAPLALVPRLWRWVPRLWRCISQVALTLVLKPLQFLPSLVGVVAEEHDVVLAFIEIET